jgi:hypothetical protein
MRSSADLAITTLAPAPVPAAAVEPTAMLEQIGTLTAIAVGAVAQALMERQAGLLTSATKLAGGDAIARLYALRQATLGKLDFNRVAREHGARLMLEHGSSGVDARAIDTLIDGVLEILAKVVRAQSN